MLDQLDELYREVILEHFRSPTHSGRIPGAAIRAEGVNPLCGDELTFYLAMEGPRISRVRFEGKGCAISQAASSMLAGALEGKTVADAGRVIGAMKAMMQGEAADASVDLGDLEALAGVRKFPVRVKCAALSWNVVEEALQQHSRSTERGDAWR